VENLSSGNKERKVCEVRMNREKVKKGLYQHCEGSMFDRCGECPYYEVADEPFQCRDELLQDTLTLLKELEPIAPVKVNRYMETDENGNWVLSETYDCGYCGGELHSKANYCHLCGRPVKRE